MCRLISLAYPGPTNNVTKIVARDSFLGALDNNTFRVRILEREPPDLDTALNIAVRLEAFDGSHVDAEQHRSSLERSQRQKEHYSRVVREEDYRLPFLSATQPEASEERFFKRFGDSMQGYICQLTEGLRKEMKVEDQGEKVTNCNGRVANGRPVLNQEGERSPSQQLVHPKWKKKGPCYNCEEFGHRAKKCPLKEKARRTMTPSQHGNTVHRQQREPRVQIIDDNPRKRSTYLTVFWRGKQYNALLDTGCEVSVVG